MVEQNRISGRTPACLFNSFNFDFRRLRRFASRGARMVHSVDGPIGVYRGFDDGTDAQIARINAELAVATDPAVAVLAREAPRARARAARPGRDPERRRPGDLPSARGTGAARCTPRPHRRDELVGQSAEGRRHARLARPQSRPRALRAHVRRSRARDVRARPHGRPARLPGRSRRSCARRTCTSPRATTIRAPTRSSRRSRAGCPRPFAQAAATRSSSVTAGSRSGTTRSSATSSSGSWASSTSGARRSRSTRSPGSPTATSTSSGLGAAT